MTGFVNMELSMPQYVILSLHTPYNECDLISNVRHELQARVETMDALDEIPELASADELKSKLLFSVVVVKPENNKFK